MAVFFIVKGGSAKRSRVNEREIIPPLRVHVGNSLAASLAPKRWTMIEGKQRSVNRPHQNLTLSYATLYTLTICSRTFQIPFYFYLLYFDYKHAFSFVAILKLKKFLLRLKAKLWLSLLDIASLCIRVTFVLCIL